MYGNVGAAYRATWVFVQHRVSLQLRLQLKFQWGQLSIRKFIDESRDENWGTESRMAGLRFQFCMKPADPIKLEVSESVDTTLREPLLHDV